MQTYTYPKSQEWFQRALKVIPSGIYGHKGPAHGNFIPVENWPLVSAKAQGTYMWDVDGNKFIDYMCGFGVNILGYCDEDVNNAAIKQMSVGDCLTTPTHKIIEYAELLTDTVKSADWAFFCKNGGDATTGAILTARHHTRKSKVVFVNGFYHGVGMWTQKIDYPGIQAGDVAGNLYIPFNDIPALEKVLAENEGEIAAFIGTPYMHGIFKDNVLPEAGYWQKVRELCTKHGIVLILDDVRCGFRLDMAGSDHYYGFEADIICFCKALANGWPVSAICGKEEFKPAISSLSFTGSYWQSSVPFAAGIAAINKMKKIDICKVLKDNSTKLCNAFAAAAENNGFDLVISGEPQLFYFRIANDENMFAHQQWIAEMMIRGVFLTGHHNHFTCAALSDDDIKVTAEVADEAFKIVRKNNPQLQYSN